MRAVVAGLAVACLGVACGGARGLVGSPEPGLPADLQAYRPTRSDYDSFRSAHPEVELLEPNYLPFMAHRAPAGAGGLLFFCRWADSAMPLAVAVREPHIPDELQDEFAPRLPGSYVAAVDAALAIWERELEGLVRFRRVADPKRATLVVRLEARRAPVPGADRQVLGATPEARRCRVERPGPEADRLDVHFAVSRVDLYLADEHGLLSPDLFQWVVLHEIGHALGMRGHSPVPADLMFEVARDRAFPLEGYRVSRPALSPEDVNSFVSLYRLPNGTVFGRVPRTGDAPPAPADPGPARLSMAPYVDARLGFEFRPPQGWLRVPTARGVVAIDGVTWEPSPSFQIVVQRLPSIEAYLERYGAYYLSRARVSRPAETRVGGRRALRLTIDAFDGELFEELTLIDGGDRVFAVVAECPMQLAGRYRPWFRAALETLEITDFSARGAGAEEGGRHGP